MRLRTTILLLSLLVDLVIHQSVKADPPPSAAPVDFNRQVRPILAENCFSCHGQDDKQRKANLHLNQHDGMLAVVKPGDHAASVLFQRISSDREDKHMPPPKTGKKLSAQQVDVLKRWIDQGAKWADHWAFIKPARPALPEVKNQLWARNAIDRFILARLESEDLEPSAEADKSTLLRRVTLDLTGLPPTLAEIDAFLGDPAPDAYEKVVERLLQSARCGERLAVDWLDAARYADTHGYHIDSARDMTRWRRWVIDAFNANKPFDQFTIEQIAGDLLPGATADQKVASGFHRNHMINFEGGAIPQEYQTAYIVDRVNTTGVVWLGLSVGCAQCHDHKFDPISQKEYYQLFAFFHNVPENGLDGTKGNAVPLLRTPTKEQQLKYDRLTAEIRKREQWLQEPNPDLDRAQADWEKTAGAGKLPTAISQILQLAAEKRLEPQKAEVRVYYRSTVAEEGKKLISELNQSKKEQAELERTFPSTMIMQEMDHPRDTFVLMRGQYDKQGEKVTAGLPAFLPQLAGGAPANRLGLARWLVSGDNPLTARVAVNRCWQMYFGTGIVKTAEDFGTQGEFPSHPDLLDWLATEFVQSGWDMKHIHRLIVTSAAYRQSSRATAQLLARDPENRLLARMPRLRLQAEFIRDQALAVSGLLDGMIGGHSVSPYQPPGLWEELMARADGANFTAQTYVQGHGKDLYRRTMYTFWKRTCPPPTLITFDAPDRETCTVRRARTNTPLQALILMNDPTYVESARKLAERIMKEGGATPDERIRFAFRALLGRPPTEKEVDVLRKMLDRQRDAYRHDEQAALKLLTFGESARDESLNPAELAAWSIVASVLLNLDETVSRG
jgi:hypothetical protein